MRVKSWYNLAVLDYVLWSLMSDLGQIVLPVVLTAILAIVGVVFVRFVVDPILRLHSLIGEIAESLFFYANVCCNPGSVLENKSDEASEVLRHQASQLKVRADAVSWYSLWERVAVVRKKTEIEEASSELLALSNSVHGGPKVSTKEARENSMRLERIKKLLGIIRDKETNGG